MILKLFSFADDTSASRSGTAHAREVQAYYDQHANAASRVSALKWLVAALLVLAGFAAWAEGDVKLNDHSKPAVAVPHDEGAASDGVKQHTGTSPTTVFIDGPTGFVFVYTAEGWKFVRGMNPGKL